MQHAPDALKRDVLYVSNTRYDLITEATARTTKDRVRSAPIDRFLSFSVGEKHIKRFTLQMLFLGPTMSGSSHALADSGRLGLRPRPSMP